MQGQNHGYILLFFRQKQRKGRPRWTSVPPLPAGSQTVAAGRDLATTKSRPMSRIGESSARRHWQAAAKPTYTGFMAMIYASDLTIHTPW